MSVDPVERAPEGSALDHSRTEQDSWPSISVVIPTRDRPTLLAQAVHSVLAQNYPGVIECLVVFDQSEPQPIDVASEFGPGRVLRTMTNTRTPGLAGARNTGLLATEHDVVGHCDDDDAWLPNKLHQQMTLWYREPEAVVVGSGVRICHDNGEHDRPAPHRATFAQFLHSRIGQIHSSNIVVRRADLIDRIGLLDEELPNSFGEDYEWLLRAARHGDIVAVPEPLILVNWDRPSFYMSKWQAMADGLSYILTKFPEFATAPRGRARLRGQIAFAHAAQGNRTAALRWARRALRDDFRQLRALGALGVAARLITAERLVRVVQARGRGL